MRTTTTTAAVSAATAGAAAAALVLLTRHRRSAPTIRTIRRTPTAVLGEYQAPTHVWARAGDDQPDPDRYTRAAITIWEVGDRYAQPYGGGVILGVSDGGYYRGSSPYGDSVYWWEPMLFPEELQEVPGGDYRRIPAHTFPIPPATIARAWQLADALTRRRTGLGDQGADSDTAAVDETEARAELRTLWQGLTAKVQGDLLADWLGTGKRYDHPVSPFLLGAATRPVDVAEVDVSGEPVEDTGCPADVPVDIDDPDRLWRQLCAAAYTIHVRECGNDGRPEDDLPTSEQQAAADHIAGRLSELVGIPTGTLHARAADAAFAHGQDPGTDDDPDRYAPPDWAHARASGLPGW
jgi:hypothetical protein